MWQSYAASISLACLSFLLILGCGSKEEPAQSKMDQEIKPTVYVPPAPEHYTGIPYWFVQSEKWPQKMEWAMPASGEYTHDSLHMRMTGRVLQSFLSGPRGKEHPLVCEFEMTIRPIPLNIVGRSFNIDSVVFYDPVRQRRLPTLPMLSSERHTEAGVVRTRFSNNLAIMHSPELTEGQLLNPTLYVTSVHNKTIVINMEPMPLIFIMPTAPGGPSPDSLKWGPT